MRDWGREQAGGEGCCLKALLPGFPCHRTGHSQKPGAGLRCIIGLIHLGTGALLGGKSGAEPRVQG